MKLYSSLTSPYARKIRVLVRELGLADRIDEQIVDPFHPPDEFLRVNPLSRIPALLTDRQLPLTDSKLIADYLQALAPRRITPPPRGQQRWHRLALRYLADGMIDSAVTTVLEKRRPESIIYTAWLDRQAEAIRRGLQQMEAQAGELRPGPERPSMLEITVGVMLGYLNFRLPYLDWKAEHPALADWFGGFAQRAAMRETQPPAG